MYRYEINFRGDQDASSARAVSKSTRPGAGSTGAGVGVGPAPASYVVVTWEKSAGSEEGNATFQAALLAAFGNKGGA